MSISKIFKLIFTLLGISFVLAFIYAIGLSKWFPNTGNPFLDDLGWIFKAISYYSYCMWKGIIEQIANWVKQQTPEIATHVITGSIVASSSSSGSSNEETKIVINLNGSKYVCYPIS